MLTIKRFSKRYNDHLILEIPHQEFLPGIYWLKGENGSGKTTLFKSMAGILPFEGEIAFKDNVEIKKDSQGYRKRVNYSEAEPSYPGFLTAKDMIRFIGKVKNESIENQEIYTKAFGVDGFFDKPCETFSSGMMKKLSLVMAFFGEPHLIILDEPLITLVEQARGILFELIRTKVKSGNTTFLISSHQSISPSDLEIIQTLKIENKKLLPS
ncbi:MAG TPA: ATP-binding cassette domain-containing protein [Cyclobacteriaceae bacterium]